MDSKLISIDITDELFRLYREYMDKSIVEVCLLHNNDDVELEIVKEEFIKNNKCKQTIIRNDLGIIIDSIDEEKCQEEDYEAESIFTVNNTIEDNLDKLLSLSPYSLVNITDLFTKEAEDYISKKYNVFGINK